MSIFKRSPATQSKTSLERLCRAFRSLCFPFPTLDISLRRSNAPASPGHPRVSSVRHSNEETTVVDGRNVGTYSASEGI